LKPEYHVAISLALSLIFYLITHSLFGSIACLLTGIFIDLDHFLDFWFIGERKISLNIKKFFEYFYNHKYKKAVILFHSIELIPIIILLGNFLFSKIVTYGILFGFISHILTDYVGNGVKPLTYFFIYRLYKKFDVSCFCRCKECHE